MGGTVLGIFTLPILSIRYLTSWRVEMCSKLTLRIGGQSLRWREQCFPMLEDKDVILLTVVVRRDRGE
jgi:hypothetical protein